MTPRRLAMIAATCLLLGFFINFSIAAILSIRNDQSVIHNGFGFIRPTFSPTVGWAGDFGRDRLSVAAGVGLEGASTADLEEQFRSVFGKPNGSFTPRELNTWSARLFPLWSGWAYRVSTGERLIIATGFPLRSFAGYIESSHSGSPMLSGTGGPAPTLHDVGFLWRNQSRPIRCIAWIPLPLGTLVNSLVYAVPLFAALSFPSFRRHLRLRRGHCPRCNYDLRADFPSGCPECGWNREAPLDFNARTT